MRCEQAGQHLAVYIPLLPSTLPNLQCIYPCNYPNLLVAANFIGFSTATHLRVYPALRVMCTIE